MKIRVISAIVALVIFIPLLCIGGIPFAVALGILSILAYKEILDLKESHGKIPKVVVILGLISLLYLILGEYEYSSVSIVISYQKVLIPLLLMLLPAVFYNKSKYQTKDAFYLLGVIYLIGLFFNLVISLREINLYLVVYLLCVTIFTDTFAFLIGSLIGKHKLSKLSPNKSWEGAIAGIIGGVAVGIIVYCNLVAAFSLKILIVTIILSIVGQLGDLVYSKIKRENDIKDFSNIMPGHGGVLDRLDNFSFTVITYVVLIWFL